MQMLLCIALMLLLQNLNQFPKFATIKLKYPCLLIDLLIENSLQLNNEDVIDML
jgi:hypothetical protein